MPAEWTSDLATGVDDIDRQHQGIFAASARLFAASAAGRGTAEVEGVLHYLYAYVRQHFTLEEQAMRRTDYPDLEAHAADHQRFLEAVRRLEREFLDQGASQAVAEKLVAMTNDWLTQHIGARDRAVAQYLVSRGEPAV